MKLNRLDSTTQQHSPDAVERARHVTADGIRRVEAQEGIEGDRQRSLQQEVAEFDARAIGPFAGGQAVLDSACELAAELKRLGGNINGLVKLPALSLRPPRIDDKA